jgi:3-hydroxyacyl-CoA dehydrogenase
LVYLRFIEGIIYLTKSDEEFDRTYFKTKRMVGSKTLSFTNTKSGSYLNRIFVYLMKEIELFIRFLSFSFDEIRETYVYPESIYSVLKFSTEISFFV